MAIGAHTFLKAELFWSFFTHAHTHRRTLAAHWTASAVGSIASVLACKNITHAKIYTHIKRRKKRVASRRETSDATNAPASVGKKKKQKNGKDMGLMQRGWGPYYQWGGQGTDFPQRQGVVKKCWLTYKEIYLLIFPGFGPSQTSQLMPTTQMHAHWLRCRLAGLLPS